MYNERMTPDTKLVPMTRAQRDALARIYVLKPPAVVGPIIAAWDAAPADPVEAVRQAIFTSHEDAHLQPYERQIIEEYVSIVLAALGYESGDKPESHIGPTGLLTGKASQSRALQGGATHALDDEAAS